MPEKTRTVTVKIEGRVQGVYYRTWTDQTARKLGLDGTVRNLDDGSVEAVFSGPADVVADMLRRCETGPRDARVSKISILSEGGSGAPVPDLSIEVDDVDEVHRRAREMGCKFVHDLTDEPWGVRRFFISDPTGKILNVLSHIG